MLKSGQLNFAEEVVELLLHENKKGKMITSREVLFSIETKRVYVTFFIMS